jgi:hypothetical protein
MAMELTTYHVPENPASPTPDGEYMGLHGLL